LQDGRHTIITNSGFYKNRDMQDMFAAASETTGTTLEWAMSELLNNPKVMAKAQLEVQEVLGPERAAITNSDLGGLHYLRMVIMETLRLHPAGVITYHPPRGQRGL
jgi:cytochrome P450